MGDNEFLRPPGRAKKITVIAAAAVVLVAVTVLVTQLVTAPTDKAEDPAPEPSASTSAGLGSPDAGVPEALTVIPGSDIQDGVSVGYPQNLVGAVSASVEYTSQLISTLDPDRAELVAAIVSDPDDADSKPRARQAALSSRQYLGVDADAAVPQGVSIALAPLGYQTRGISDTQVTVLLLADLTTTSVNGTTQTRSGVYPVVMTWHGDDWKLAPLLDGNDYSRLIAPLHSPEADAMGWKTLTR